MISFITCFVTSNALSRVHYSFLRKVKADFMTILMSDVSLLLKMTRINYFNYSFFHVIRIHIMQIKFYRVPE